MFIIDKIYYSTSLDDVNDIAILLKIVSSDCITKKLLAKIKNRARLPKFATIWSYASIRSLFRKRSIFDKVKDIISLDYWIANYNKTMSTYKKFLYRIQFLKYILSQSFKQRVEELTHEKSFLL